MALTAQFTAGQDLTAAALNASSIPVVTATSDITTPFTGQIIFNVTDGLLYKYTGALWVPFQYNSVQLAPGDSGTITSTTYINNRTGGVAQVGVAFKAPAIGSVRIDWACGVSNTVATNFSLASIEVRTGTTVGSGTIVLAASDNYTLQFSGTAETKITDYYLLTGLTPAADYNARIMFRTNAGTSTFNRPKILVASAI